MGAGNRIYVSMDHDFFICGNQGIVVGFRIAKPYIKCLLILSKKVVRCFLHQIFFPSIKKNGKIQCAHHVYVKFSPDNLTPVHILALFYFFKDILLKLASKSYCFWCWCKELDFGAAISAILRFSLGVLQLNA